MAESSNVKPPKHLVVSSGSDAFTAWKSWYQQFKWYATATNLDAKKPEVQVAIFMSCIGPDAAVIYNTFNLSDSEANSLKDVTERFVKHFTPQINETYERYTFNSIAQQEGQTFDDFLTKLKSKVRTCGYGELEESIIRDRIVLGTLSDAVREKLLAEPKLTLQRTVDIICRSVEQAKNQVKTMKQTTTVESITYNSKNKGGAANKSKEKDLFQCGRCDTKHGPRACPAFGKVCRLCRRKNHVPKCCKSQKVNTVTAQDSEN